MFWTVSGGTWTGMMITINSGTWTLTVPSEYGQLPRKDFFKQILKQQIPWPRFVYTEQFIASEEESQQTL